MRKKLVNAVALAGVVFVSICGTSHSTLGTIGKVAGLNLSRKYEMNLDKIPGFDNQIQIMNDDVASNVVPLHEIRDFWTNAAKNNYAKIESLWEEVNGPSWSDEASIFFLRFFHFFPLFFRFFVP